MKVMTIELEPELAGYIDELVASGRYENANKAMAEAVQRLREDEFDTPEDIARLNAMLQEAYDDIERNGTMELDLDAIFEEAMAKAGHR